MIDTNKYEGHTPGRWTVDEEDPCRVIDAQECTIARTDFINIEEEEAWQSVNAQLIAGAPLLLEEVERLQEERKQIRELLAEVLPRKDGVPHILHVHLASIAIILGMMEREEE